MDVRVGAPGRAGLTNRPGWERCVEAECVCRCAVRMVPDAALAQVAELKRPPVVFKRSWTKAILDMVGHGATLAVTLIVLALCVYAVYVAETALGNEVVLFQLYALAMGTPNLLTTR